MKFKSGEEYVKNLVNEFCPEPTVVSSIRLDTYFKKAHNLFHEALDFVKMGEGKEAHAYIYLMRYSQLIMALQSHKDYNDKQYASERQKNMRRVKNAVIKLEELKPHLIALYDQEIENEKNNSKNQSNLSTNETNNQTKDKEQDTNTNKSGNENETKTQTEMGKAISSKTNLPPKERWNNLMPSNNTNDKNDTGLDNMFNNNELGKIIVPNNLVKDFIKHAEKNTKNDIETCAVLTGKCDSSSNTYIITHVILPKQNGSSNTVQTIGEEELIEVQEKHELITLGWIHTHPSQTCFLSSVDMHCQLSYQIMLSNAIAIVYAPKDTTSIFSLTKTGLEVLSTM